MPRDSRGLIPLVAALSLWMATQAHAAATEVVVKLSPAQIDAAGITLAQPHRATDGSAGNTLRLTGRVTVPNRNVELVVAAVAGHIQAVLVNVGETVRRGAPLLRVYSADWVVQQREYLHAAAQADMTRQKLQRDEMLYQEGIIALGRLEETRTAHAKAQADLNEQRQLLKLAGIGPAQIAQLQGANGIESVLTVTAPMGGVVLEQSVTPGARVEPGAPLLKLADTNTLWVELQASQTQTAQLRTGDRAVAVTCGKTGTLIAISPQVDAASQTALVVAEFPNADACLRPNQYVETDVDGTAAQDALSIPASALVRSGGRDHVFVQTPGGLQLQPVTVQARQHEVVWIESTLGTDAKVAVSGIAALRGAVAGLGMEE